MKSPEDEIKRLLLSAELDLLQRLRDRTDILDARVGDETALRESTREVIVDVLRDAGVHDHERLSRVMAPLVVSSMREEIRNSRDMMVDALYPITGQLVAAAVRNAFRDLMETLNETLDRSFSFERWRIWLQARLTRRSEAELWLQRYPPFEIEDLLVVHRPTGILVARVRATQDDGEGLDSDLLSGMLTAIMLFVRDAMADSGGGDLQRLEFGGSVLYLRSSPAVILAVKATGTEPTGFDAALERTFQAFLARWGESLRAFDGDVEEAPDLQGDLRERLAGLVAARRKNFRSGRSWKAPALIVLALLGLLAWGGLVFFEMRRAGEIETTARETLAVMPELVGFPIEVRYERDQNRLAVQGLFPDQGVLDSAQGALAAALPGQLVTYETNLISRGETEQLSQQLARLRDGLGGLESSLDDALTAVQPELERLGEQASALESATGALESSIGDTAKTADAQAAEIDRRLETLGSETAQLESALSRAIKTIADQAVVVGERTDNLEAVTSRLDRSLAETAQASEAQATELLQRVEAFRTVTAQLEDSVAQLAGASRTQGAELAGRMKELEALSRRLDSAIEETKQSAAGGLEATNTRSRGLEDAVGKLEQRVSEALALIEAQGRQLTARTEDLQAATGRLRSSLEGALAAAGQSGTQVEDRVAGLESSVGNIQRALGLLSSDLESVARGAETKPVQLLSQWADRNAIFFARRSEFTDEAAATRTLEGLVGLMGSMPENVRLRIIGYADPIGTLQINREVSLARADRVAEVLVEMGLARDRLVTVGRADQNALVGHGGDASPNRRVEFEVAFFGDDQESEDSDGTR